MESHRNFLLLISLKVTSIRSRRLNCESTRIGNSIVYCIYESFETHVHVQGGWNHLVKGHYLKILETIHCCYVYIRIYRL